MIFTDHVVARIAQLIGAPVPQPDLIFVSRELIEINPEMAHIQPGIAHGSRHLADVGERLDNITHLDIPENRTRFALLAVLGAWVFASDRQFIYGTSPPQLVYSVDHGHFLPGGPNGPFRH
jgi:hypothetical protein